MYWGEHFLANHWQPKPNLEQSQATNPYSMPFLLWSLLKSRGIDSQEKVDVLINPSLQDLTHPLKIDGMDKARERFFQAYNNNEKICIYGDFDLDGSSGVALLNHGLQQLGYADLVLYQPKRLTEGYGFHEHAVEALHKQGVSLIITVDVGITAVEAVNKANELGIDVVITDHHLPKKELPDALAVVNPNKGTCESGLGHLCGCGVGFYFIMALKLKFSEMGLPNSVNLKSLLDLFTIGTLTDLVPLVEENRVLFKYGLLELQKTKRPGLSSLLKELKLKDKPSLSSQDVAIRFAPKLNALSRLEKGILPLDIFNEQDAVQAGQLVSEVISNNQLRIKLQDQALTEAEEIALTFSEESFILAASEDFHQGVVGLVATRLSQSDGKPSFVGSIKGDFITGSARIPKNSSINLVLALEACTGVLEEFGGHAPAAGFRLKAERLEEFLIQLKQYFDQFDSDSAGPEVEVVGYYDLEASIDDFTPDYIPWLKKIEPFGVSFEDPIYKLTGAVLESYKVLKGGHLRLNLQSGVTKKTIPSIWFSPWIKTEQLDLLLSKPIEALVEAQANYFAGRETLQLMIKEFKF